MKRRVLFIGSVDFSGALLERILRTDCVDICGIVTKRHSSYNSDHRDLSLSLSAEIPVCYTERGDEKDILPWALELKPDAIYCFGWSHLLGKNLLSAAPLGCVGYHPALLPHNRGRHPIIWALALGLPQTGSSFFLMKEEADAGDILSQRTVPIDGEDDAGTLYDKLKKVACDQTEEIDAMVARGALQGFPQPFGVGNIWRKRCKADGKIDFRMSSWGIHNLVRALRPPYPGAHLEYQKMEYVVGRADVLAESFSGVEFAEPGKILDVCGGKLYVRSGDGVVALSECDLPDSIQVGDYFS